MPCQEPKPGRLVGQNGEQCTYMIRYPQTFKTHAESFAACEHTWNKSYKRLPDWDLAFKYTGGDDTQTWLNNFYSAYNKL